jgi:hypothetical protein
MGERHTAMLTSTAFAGELAPQPTYRACENGVEDEKDKKSKKDKKAKTTS